MTLGETVPEPTVPCNPLSHDREYRVRGRVRLGGWQPIWPAPRSGRGSAAADEVTLRTDCHPDAVPGSGVPDPWYGPDSDFEDTLAAVEAAMPGIVTAVRERLGL